MGIPLPKHWVKMPSADMTVHKVPLPKSFSEYEDVMRKFQATTSGVTIQKIERIQNPPLYLCYMVRKQKMDKDIGGEGQRQLFDGTHPKNVTHINTRGFKDPFSLTVMHRGRFVVSWTMKVAIRVSSFSGGEICFHLNSLFML